MIKNIENLKFFLTQYEELKKLAKKLHRLYTLNCNYGLTKRQEKIQEKTENKVKEIVNNLNKVLNLNLKPYFQGDPRGLPLFLVNDDCKYNLNGYDYIDYHKGIAIYI